jgi:hypothetical protein
MSIDEYKKLLKVVQFEQCLAKLYKKNYKVILI